MLIQGGQLQQVSYICGEGRMNIILKPTFPALEGSQYELATMQCKSEQSLKYGVGLSRGLEER